MNELRIALAGNPNSGKTTLFNALTGARQRVGNWPGVTVERVVGELDIGDTHVQALDLPGIYSFSAFSIDESIARRYILLERPDLVVNVVDATNMERNLYLTTQLLEMKAPLVVVLNMMDMARRRRIRIDVAHLARHLGCPVIPVVASKGEGLDELREAIIKTAREHEPSHTRVFYDSELEKSINLVEEQVAEQAATKNVNARWLALKLLEKDAFAEELAGEKRPGALIDSELQRVEKHTGEDSDIVIADGRYGFIHGLVRDVVHRDLEVRKTVSHALDEVMLNRVLGLPLFLLVMYAVFALTINVSTPFIDFFDILFGALFVDGLDAALSVLGSPAWLTMILVNGLGQALQTVATFVPPITMMFLCLAFLEDSGYMARAAFVMDRSLRTVGLPGKAFIPMLVGFGCNVPGIMATRTLENSRDRILTVLINPLMSCGARLPVYALFAAIFFPNRGGAVLFMLYATGIVLAVITATVFKRTILRGEVSTFVMELPPYHLPTVGGILYHTWTRLQAFLIRAGRAIVIVVVVLGIINSVSPDGRIVTDEQDKSILSVTARKITPVFRPMGVTDDNWPAAVGLFTGVLAKETVVGVLDSLYAQIDERARPADAEEPPFQFWEQVGEAFRAIPVGFDGFWRGIFRPFGGGNATSAEEAVDMRTISAMKTYFGGAEAALAYLLFVLIYSPCIAAIAAIGKETNYKWALFAVGYLTFLAWNVATLFYQIATLGQHPAQSAQWIVICLLMLALLVAALRLAGRYASPEEVPHDS